MQPAFLYETFTAIDARRGMMPLSSKLSSPAWESVHFVEAHELTRLCHVSTLEGSTTILDVSMDTVVDKDSLLGVIAGALRFPSYFSRNWDALEECLRDMTWLPAPHYVLALHGAERLWTENPRIAGQLVECWLACAEDWARSGVGFHLVFVW